MLAITKEVDCTLQHLQDEAERLMVTHTLRLKVLEQMLFEGVNHTVTSRKRHNQQINFPAGTTLLRSESEVSDIVQVMVDRDTDCYKRNWKGRHLLKYLWHGLALFLKIIFTYLRF